MDVPLKSLPSGSFGRHHDNLDRIEARSKYRAQTSSPSDGEDVRWYFSKAPLSLDEPAASVPVAEVVGKSDFLRFSVNDSLALEMAFLEQEEELVSAWWKEYAECSVGPLGDARTGGSSKSDAEGPVDRTLSSPRSGALDSNMKELNSNEPYESDEVIGVTVKGGLYEVDLFRRRCLPVYWIGDHRRVLRGHWFAQKGGLDWLPLREDISEQLEIAYQSQVWHRRTFQPSGRFAARVNLQGATEGLHALFMGEDDTWEACLGMDASGISLVLGLRESGIKLRRGFAPSQSPQPTQDELHQRREEEMDDYCSQVPVRHLVFMVHGIGQRLEKANLVDDVTTFRHVVSALAEHHLTAYQRNSQRVLFIPCQWRRGLKLKGEEAVENCTLEGVRALRTMLSATVHDVLYYMSAVYSQHIIDSVTGQLNRLYRKFIKRNPGYDGKVSLYGHSLGSVLSYDILCHQRDPDSVSLISQINETLQKTDGHGSQTDCIDEHLAAKDTDDSVVDQANEKEIDVLRSEVAKLKAKLMALEEGHYANPHEVKSHEVDRGYPNSGDETTLYRNSPQEGDFSTLASIYQNNRSSDSPDSRQIPIAPEEKSSCNISVERDVVDAPDGVDSASSSALPLKIKLDRRNGCSNVRSNSRKRRYTPRINYTILAFEVDTFFAVGSPLGVFLALRNVRLGDGMGKDYWQDDAIDEEMPACKRMLNVFHPFDPVAYRIEPLVCKEYIGKRPVLIPYHRGGKRLHIGIQEIGEGISARSKAFVHSLTTAGDRVVRVFSTASTEKAPVERTYGSLVMERLTGDPLGRIDYMLQDATFEHQYLQAISSHTSYWRDHDTALFIIKHLYGDIPERSPESNVVEAAEGSEDSISIEPLHFLKSNLLADEEVAFTFSNKESVIAVMSDADTAYGTVRM